MRQLYMLAEAPPAQEPPPASEAPPVPPDTPVEAEPPVDAEPPADAEPPVDDEPPLEAEPPVDAQPPVDNFLRLLRERDRRRARRREKEANQPSCSGWLSTATLAVEKETRKKRKVTKRTVAAPPDLRPPTPPGKVLNSTVYK